MTRDNLPTVGSSLPFREGVTVATTGGCRCVRFERSCGPRRETVSKHSGAIAGPDGYRGPTRQPGPVDHGSCADKRSPRFLAGAVPGAERSFKMDDLRADTLKDLDIGRERLTGHRGQARVCFVALSPAPLAFGGCKPRIDLVELVRRSGNPMFADWLRRRRRSPRLSPALVAPSSGLRFLMTNRAATCSRYSMTGTIENPPSSPASYPSTNGTTTSANLPSPMPSSTGSCTTLTNSISRENPCAKTTTT